MLRWAWRSKSTGEPMTCLLVSHYLTRSELTDLLCSHAEAATGAKLSQRAVLQAVRRELAAATVLEPIETWACNYTVAEAKARQEWAEALVSRL